MRFDKRGMFILLPVLTLSLALVGCSKGPVEKDRIQKPIQNAASKEQALKEEKEFIVAGSGANIPLIRKIAKAYQEKNPDVKITIPDSIGSSGAITGVKQGELEFGLTSRVLKEEEVKSGLKEIPYQKVGQIIAVHPTVPDDNLTYKEYVDIMNGTKAKWNDGNDIVVLMREKEDSTNNILEKIIPGFEQVLDKALAEGKWKVLNSDPEMEQALMTTPYGIGYTDTGSMAINRLPIKPLKINGVEPTVENMKLGKYELTKTSYIIYKEPLSERAQKFVEFILSDEGKKIIEDHGYVPLDKK